MYNSLSSPFHVKNRNIGGQLLGVFSDYWYLAGITLILVHATFRNRAPYVTHNKHGGVLLSTEYEALNASYNSDF